MGTCIFYVDEGGSPLPHVEPLLSGQTPLITLGAVALPLARWREMDRGLLRLKRHYFPDLLAATTSRDEYFEIKGNELASPRNAKSERRHAYLDAVLAFIASLNGKCFGVSIVKSSANPTNATRIYTTALHILAESFHDYIAKTDDYENGIVICDTRKGMGAKKDRQVAVSYLSYLFGHRQGKTFTSLVEAPLFADSKLTAGLQIADNFTSALYALTYAKKCAAVPGGHNYSHMLVHEQKVQLLEYRNVDKGMYGFRTIVHR
jgi:hypothetical protein